MVVYDRYFNAIIVLTLKSYQGMQLLWYEAIHYLLIPT